MSKPETKSGLIDDLKVAKPVEQVQESTAEKKEPTQELLDWRASFESDLKTDESLLKFKTAEDLAKSYKELERKIGHNVRALSPDMKPEEVGTELQKVLKLNKEAYKVEGMDEEVLEKGLRLGLQPEGLKQLSSLQKEAFKKQAKKEHEAQINQWKESFMEGKAQDEVEKDLAAGLESLEMDSDKYKSIFGDRALHPEILSYVESRGKEHRKDGITKIKEGTTTGGLPSGLDELQVLYDKTSISLAVARDQGNQLAADKYESELKKIAAKLGSIGGTRGSSGVL